MSYCIAKLEWTAAAFISVTSAILPLSSPVVAADWAATVVTKADLSPASRRSERKGTSTFATGSIKAARVGREKTGVTSVPPPDGLALAASKPAAIVRPPDYATPDVPVVTAVAEKRTTEACSLLVDEAAKTALEAERRSVADATRELVRQSDLIERRIQVLKDWMEKRDLLVRKMTKLVVETYSAMKPEAAAAQLAVMELGQAGAIVSRLLPQKVSAIVSEMEPGKAAAILAALASAVAADGEPSGEK